MQNKPSNDQHKNIYYRLRRSDPHERLSARLRHFSFGAAVFFVVAAAGIVTHSLYNIQIKQGATFRQYAAQQQLLDSTIQATRGEIYDASGITLASTSVVWTIWADPSYSTALFTSQTVEETGESIKTVDETTLADVSRQLTLRLLSGDGESLDSVDTSSAEYQTQYQTVHDALAKNGSSYQVLATKVNNAVKLSIEKYISEYNKNHAKAKTLEDGTAIKKGRISVSSSKSFQRDYPYGAFAASVLGFCNGDGEGFYGLENPTMTPSRASMAARSPSAMPTATPSPTPTPPLTPPRTAPIWCCRWTSMCRRSWSATSTRPSTPTRSRTAAQPSS